MRLPFAFTLIAGLTVAAEVPTQRFSITHMDPSVAPGDDFFSYACGAWAKSAKIPADRSSWGPTDALQERNSLLLRVICEEAANHPQTERAAQLVGDYFAAASDEAAIEKRGWQPLEPDLKEVAEAKDKVAFAAVVGAFHGRGNEPFFGWYVDADERHSERYAMHLVQGGLTLPERGYYLDESFAEVRVKYVAHIEKMLQLAGNDEAKAKAEAAVVMRLETSLARASKPAEELNDTEKNYHAMPRTQLSELAPGFDWAGYWKAINVQPEGIIVAQPEFLTAMTKLFDETSLDDLKIYVRWSLITGAAGHLHKAVDTENFAFFGKVIRGAKEQRPRWKRAVAAVDGILGDALGQLYVEQHFPAAARTKMETMVSELKLAFREHIQKATWMSEATRVKALAKLERFGAKLGHPMKWKDYAGLELHRDDYAGNAERASAWEIRRHLARIGKPVDRSEWSMTAPTVNAYFDPTKNEIVFPAGILQPPFFDLEMDDAVNFGSTAAIIGHEMTHGFDSDGRKFDAEGNLTDWWTEADATEYERRAEVLVKQFDAREALPGLHVNGKLTLPENIADLGGIVLAFDALQKVLKTSPEKRKLIDGLTPEQRYFISYAQSWMSLDREELVRQRNTSDSHAPDRLRAVVPLQNCEAWYETFGVKAGDKLWIEPKSRASIW